MTDISQPIILPKPNENCCVPSDKVMKRAALLFDRLFRPYESEGEKEYFESPPEEIRYYVEIDEEDGQLDKLITDSEKMIGQFVEANKRLPVDQELTRTTPYLRKMEISITRMYVRVSQLNGIDAIPIYRSINSFETDFRPGKHAIYQAALSSMPTVIEEKLSWDQVMDFRQDREAKRKYRDLMLWLSDGLKADSVGHAEDIISKKIDDYTWAIKKHGLKTITGSIATALNSDFLIPFTVATGATFAATGPIGAAIAGGLLLTAQVTTHIAEQKIDLEDVKRGDNSEIAYIYDIRDKFGDKAEE